MCPMVHAIGNGLVDHSVVNKTEKRINKNNFKNIFSPAQFSFSSFNQTTIISKSGVSQKLSIYLPSNSTPNLSILSTVKLIL